MGTKKINTVWSLTSLAAVMPRSSRLVLQLLDLVRTVALEEILVAVSELVAAPMGDPPLLTNTVGDPTVEVRGAETHGGNGIEITTVTTAGEMVGTTGGDEKTHDCTILMLNYILLEMKYT